MFGAKKREAGQEGSIIGFTKPRRFLFLKIKSKPIYGKQPQAQKAQAAPVQQEPKSLGPMPMTFFGLRAKQMQKEKEEAAQGIKPIPAPRRQGGLKQYLSRVAAKNKDLEAALRAQGLKESPYEFVRKMFIYSMIISVVITASFGALLFAYGLNLVLALALGVACFYALFNRFIRYPLDRNVVVGKDIEKDILFAARDLVISMRSGMPLFNAITAVSTGYGAASKEFAKIVELVQLGMPIDQALDEVSSRSKSKTFKRIMLQTTVSLKVGADVVSALQGVVEEVGQERIIELRRYGQRLNALAMFYMLFGVIFPSMGIAVAAILTTFISIFTVDENTLLFAFIGICFLQIIFLNIMRSSRPTFAM